MPTISKINRVCFTLLLILSIFIISACSKDTANNTELKEANTIVNDNSSEESNSKNNKDSGVKGVVDGKPVPSLEGKKIGVAVIGTYHNWDRQAFQGQIDRIKELGGIPIAVDGERNDQKHIADIENLISQKPDAIIKQLGDTKVFAPVLKKYMMQKFLYLLLIIQVSIVSPIICLIIITLVRR